MTRLRGAIIGFGNVAARGHWPGLAVSPDLEIVAIVDPSEARRAAALALAPELRVFRSVEDLTASGEVLDFVDIATPPSSHAPLVEAALGRGWHVLCEKPLTLDPAVFARLAGGARVGTRVLFTMHNWKVAPIFQAAFRALASGRVGLVRHVDVLVYRHQPCKGTAAGGSEDWRQDAAIAGGGILVDHGWHNFYLLGHLAGGAPRTVAAQLTHLHDDPAALDDSARLVVTFPDADAYLHLTWRATQRRNAVVVHGDAGTLVLDDDRLVVAVRGEQPEVVAFPAGLSAGSHHDDWFRALLPEFVEEVRDPRARGRNLREAAWCVALTDAAYRSAAEGGREVRVRGIEN